jgi:Lrp/AsnC family leucine-responsive transcriptional regulator
VDLTKKHLQCKEGNGNRLSNIKYTAKNNLHLKNKGAYCLPGSMISKGGEEALKMSNLDEIDKQIISILQKDSRTSYAEIARSLFISRVAVRDRVNNLLKEGVIEEFTVVINAKSIGYNLNVFLDIQVEPSKLEEVASRLVQEENVIVVYQMTGPTTLHVHACVESPEALNAFMRERIYPIPGITHVESHILLARYKAKLNIR